jgi:hypothetical protein
VVGLCHFGTTGDAGEFCTRQEDLLFQVVDVSEYYFHRPLHELFGVYFKAGLAMDALEEPQFADDVTSARVESTLNYKQFPPIMAFRMRKVNGGN